MNMVLFWFSILLFNLVNLQANGEFTPIVQLNGGKVRGTVEEAFGHQVYLYQGIRFGRANRFEKPRLSEPLAEVYNATYPRDQCPQSTAYNLTIHGMSFETSSMSEDCLFVSVWRPAQESVQNRSVMFFVHGGGFSMGTIFSPFQDAKYLVAEGNVIVVSVSYRLGALGFLYGGDVPGNLGLHDQILGLKWVRDNIHHFGGDPNQVTIFGASAGSFSIGSLILSPLTKGMFKRAILQSGAPNSHLGAFTRNKSLELTKDLAKTLKCPLDNVADTIACLKYNKTANEIVAATRTGLLKDQVFVPIYGDEVMPIAPVEALKSGEFNRDFDLMFGGSRDEGSGFVFALYPSFRQNNLTVQSLKQNIVEIIKFYKLSRPEEVEDFYTSNLTQNSSQDDLRITMGNVIGDYHLVCPTVLFAEQIAKHSPTNRFYSYRLMQPFIITNSPVEYFPWKGVEHGDDSLFIYAIPLQTKPEYQQISREMRLAWTSFARTGVPGKMGSTEWVEAFESKTNPVTRYMSIKAGDYKMVDGHFRRTCDAFWKDKITQ